MAFVFDFDPQDYDDDQNQPAKPSAFAGVVWLIVVVLIPAIAVAGVTAFAAIALLPVLLISIWPSFAAAIQVPWIRAIVVVAIVAFSILLYLLRRFFRVVYGVLELSVGAVSAWACLSQTNLNRLTVMVGILAAAYIIVRGLDNIAQARNLGMISVGRLRLSEKSGNIQIRDTWAPDAPRRVIQVREE